MSTELKSTLEREIGVDEIRSEFQGTSRASNSGRQGNPSFPEETNSLGTRAESFTKEGDSIPKQLSQDPPPDTNSEAKPADRGPMKEAVGNLSMEELEAELARRKAAASPQAKGD